MASVITRGALIVLEGCDRAGKTTQARLLIDSLEKRGVNVKFMRFPERTTQIGSLINKYLTCVEEQEDHAIHLLFSANRWESVPSMIRLLKEGTTIIIDRYAFSGVAFSAAKENLALDWCKQCDIGIPRPDLVLFFDLSMKEMAKRGGFGGERYEASKFQEIVYTNYIKLMDKTWRKIDAHRPIDVIQHEVEKIVVEAIETHKTSPLRRLWIEDDTNG